LSNQEDVLRTANHLSPAVLRTTPAGNASAA
jgi:hypothetical protein